LRNFQIFLQMHQRWIMIIRHCKIVCFMSRAHKQICGIYVHADGCLFVWVSYAICKRLLYQQPEFCRLVYFGVLFFLYRLFVLYSFSHLHINLFICINICMLFDLAHPDPIHPPKAPTSTQFTDRLALSQPEKRNIQSSILNLKKY